MNHKKSLALILLLFSTLISFAAVYFKDYFKDFQSLGLLGIFLINFFSSATFFVSGPAFLTVIAGGSLYPPVLVALVATLGSSAGDMISYLFGLSGRHLAIKRLEKKFWFRIFEDLFKAHGKIVLFVVSFIPNPLFDAVGLFAGVFGFHPGKFFFIVFLGRFARFIAFALIGAKFY